MNAGLGLRLSMPGSLSTTMRAAAGARASWVDNVAIAVASTPAILMASRAICRTRRYVISQNIRVLPVVFTGHRWVHQAGSGNTQRRGRSATLQSTFVDSTKVFTIKLLKRLQGRDLVLGYRAALIDR